ncbi:hypothetical protein CF68_33015 [Cupriavidus sp. SK-4]|uniref:hypothetical protein n=1 Tax=Cupriavidus sp. SK-4 TaxID=574750 RepID=UPI0004517F2A|nr:hypothetical protein [Cupriavidus sp. SK-4]EYS89467.1 hypothetical protein CF68_33015 [Cupriavidus sp. SK-4]
MNAPAPVAELTQLAGGPSIEKAIGERQVRITPLKVKEFGPMLSALDPVFVDIGVLPDAMVAGDIVHLFTRHAEALLTAICIGARVERAWLDEQELDVPVNLFADVLSVNRDFFEQRLKPVASQLQAMFPGGSTSLSSSSGPATA